MPSLSSQWKGVKAAWDDDTSAESPGTRFGLMFDPLAYILGDKYRNLINKSGDESNRSLSHLLNTDKKGGWVANKPASTIGLIVGGSYAGSGMFGGAGGGSGGASPLGGAQGGSSPMGGMGGMQGKMPQMPQQQQEQQHNTVLEDELDRQAKEAALKKQIAAELGPRYV